MKRDPDPALSALDDYIRGQGDNVAAYEADLFERALAGDAPELRLRDALGRTFRSLNARGALELWLTAKDVERLRQSTRVDYRELERAMEPVAADAELMVVRIPLDLAGVRRLDAEVSAPDGRMLKRMPDIAFDAADAAIFSCCEADLARFIHTNNTPTVTRIYGTYDDGRRLVLEL